MSEIDSNIFGQKHILDSIALKSWNNVPKCIIDTFQLLIQHVKANEAQIENVDQNHRLKLLEFEKKFDNFGKVTTANTKEMVENLDQLKETVDRTLKNMSSEIMEANTRSAEDRAKLNLLGDIVQTNESEIKTLNKNCETFEERGNMQKLINALSEEIHSRVDSHQASVK